jgi:hypothetical protein
MNTPPRSKAMKDNEVKKKKKVNKVKKEDTEAVILLIKYFLNKYKRKKVKS